MSDRDSDLFGLGKLSVINTTILYYLRDTYIHSCLSQYTQSLANINTVHRYTPYTSSRARKMISLPPYLTLPVSGSHAFDAILTKLQFSKAKGRHRCHEAVRPLFTQCSAWLTSLLYFYCCHPYHYHLPIQIDVGLRSHISRWENVGILCQIPWSC